MMFDGIWHCASGVRKEMNGSQHSGNGDEMQDEIKDDPSYQRTVTGKPPADPSKEMLTLQGTIGMPGNIRALRMSDIPELLKLDSALKGSQPVHGYCLHSLKDEIACMTCFATCKATVHHMTATGSYVVSNYLVRPAQSM